MSEQMFGFIFACHTLITAVGYLAKCIVLIQLAENFVKLLTSRELVFVFALSCLTVLSVID